MNLAEKLATSYLRLNGFLCINQFTLFGRQYHTHVDILGLRGPHSAEEPNGIPLPVDDNFLNLLSQCLGQEVRSRLTGLVAEVRTNQNLETPLSSNCEYAARFLGTNPLRVAFYHFQGRPHLSDGAVFVSLSYAGHWIRNRIRIMNEREDIVSKSQSWNWSEEFLSDFMTLQKVGLIEC